jgi:hypothetical protein
MPDPTGAHKAGVLTDGTNQAEQKKAEKKDLTESPSFVIFS